MLAVFLFTEAPQGTEAIDTERESREVVVWRGGFVVLVRLKSFGLWTLFFFFFSKTMTSLLFYYYFFLFRPQFFIFPFTVAYA